MDQQAAAKQQVVERLKQANNILVTVSNDPSVDQLAACIGMTLFLTRLGKNVTAVFSGKIPPAIDFLEPEKTLVPNVDSLRDFIISLDKAKADKLRYKVEDQFVRIYITPYRTVLNEEDFEFGQGDFNVEAVLALGVHDRSHLDAAITAHGKILHDATVISVSSGPGSAANLGQINWHETTASCLCEMLVSISEAFGTGLIDNQMATAFLTGIVAETGRFSNEKTTPKVMTMAAQLMAAGANQKLIVAKLEPPPPKEPPPAPPATEPPPKPVAPKKPKPSPPKPEGEIDVARGGNKQGNSELEVSPNEIYIDKEGNLSTPNAPTVPKKKDKPPSFFVAQPPPLPTANSHPPIPALAEPTHRRTYLNDAQPAYSSITSNGSVLNSVSPKSNTDDTPVFALPGENPVSTPPTNPGSEITPAAPPPVPPPLPLRHDMLQPR